MDVCTADMCDKSWGRPTFVKVLVDVWVVNELKQELEVLIPSLDGSVAEKVKIQVEYVWEMRRAWSHSITFKVGKSSPRFWSCYGSVRFSESEFMFPESELMFSESVFMNLVEYLKCLSRIENYVFRIGNWASLVVMLTTFLTNWESEMGVFRIGKGCFPIRKKGGFSDSVFEEFLCRIPGDRVNSKLSSGKDRAARGKEKEPSHCPKCEMFGHSLKNYQKSLLKIPVGQKTKSTAEADGFVRVERKQWCPKVSSNASPSKSGPKGSQ
ncbi:hypothetical protein OSB04_028880 [Centaurea solstitialis]|uniref:Uncharacterized protein n=1 Tax=Centaurea solstitialis TaxID=347529 RepID=A0AA38W9Q6_9ASTR|nr:hypothetical protein OSB04_028880 [Centaurea solstitialis]